MFIKYNDNKNMFYDLDENMVVNSTRIKQEKGVTFIEFTPFDKFNWVKLAFSTRLGGVSEGIYSSMNFSFDRGDDKDKVIENYNIFTEAIGITPDKCVSSKQTHTNNVLKVEKRHLGMGVVKDRDFNDIDGLITNEKNICLITSFADCVPVYFIDPVNKCIGASHSGWRGTVSDITAKTVELMKQEFGTDPSKLYAYIGPSICQTCYEVDEPVAYEFRKKYKSEELDRILETKENGKYQLNLWIANLYNMINSGIDAKNIGITDMCTCCNSELLFSHRASHGNRGVLCGFIYIK